jgi:ActR/RegA family two-component response regulator
MAGALPGAELGQVGDPRASGRVDAEVAADQVRGEPMLLSSRRRAFALLGVDRDQPSLPHQPGDTLLADRHTAAELELVEDPWRAVGLLALLEDLKTQGVATPVVMMSGQAHIDMAVRATRLGALDFLEKPISTDKLLLTVENALKLQQLESENRQLRHRLGKPEVAAEAFRRHGRVHG